MTTALIFLSLALLEPAPQAADAPKPAPDNFKPDPAWKPQGKALWFDPTQRRLVIRAKVSIQDGFLEHLLCRTQSKEHESILATDAEPRMIHAGLLLTGAEPGHPVRFRPEFVPPAGTPIAITLEWNAPDGTRKTAPARQWIKDQKTGKHLIDHFVFAGSILVRDEDTGKTIYGADSGDLFTVANFTNAILDLPFASSADDTSRSFKADPDQVPPRGTWVTMYLQPLNQDSKPKPDRPG
jgi:hypothetical protein